MTPAQKQQKLNEVFNRVAAHFAARFAADPALNEIYFPSTRLLVRELREAYISLWTYTDADFAGKLANAGRLDLPVRFDCAGPKHSSRWIIKRGSL